MTDELICEHCGANLAEAGVIENSDGGHGETIIHIKNGYIVYEQTTIENMDSIVAVCGSCHEELEEPIDEILWEMEERAKSLPDIFELIKAYRELWEAVENGTLEGDLFEQDFFKYREDARKLLG